MYELNNEFEDYYGDKAAYYRSLVEQLKGLLSIERHPMTNMSQMASFIYHSIPQLNWAGFYLTRNEQLQLGPYHGKVACVHIPFGRGVCGWVAENKQSIKVDNVHEFDGHIACDSASNAEIVVPVMLGEQLWGVLDIDSPELNRFDAQDLEGFESLVQAFCEVTDLEKLVF
ncbi:GAF domain-containing protein [Pleionea sp. CnH1-48]|uniref:GAF domain-containing protein n=1 Tax=Pleionea sp. CnH1-48 TaxID=2954494 RepID=UPI002096CE2A|nr:GAF domain-containing protein [Pleionea sp. CnH1-48]MCO7224216.1 GAF domain-containing protein [Pleionea sp. CnH1-48]